MLDELADEGLRSWVAGLDGLFARVAGRFGRVEPRRQARLYVMGLLAPLERKNGWQLAEAAGDPAPDRMQRLLASARWDFRLVREDLRGYVAGHLGGPGGVLIVDLCRHRDYAEAQAVGAWLSAGQRLARGSA